MPLLNSTSAAKAGRVDSSRGFTVYADVSTMRGFAHTDVALAVDNWNDTTPGKPAGQPGAICAPVGIRTPNL